MSKPLRILMVEDSALDAELIQRELRKSFPLLEVQCVKNEKDFTAALKDPQPDLILSDYTLPSFSGPAALKLARLRSKEIPFISISGSIGEERLVEMMQEGASDYVPKSNLGKLIPAVQRALREVEQTRQRCQAEESLRHSESRFRAIFEGASTGISVEDLDGHIVETNLALQQMLGYTSAELQSLTRQDFTHARDHREDRAHYERLLSGESEYYQVEKRFVRKDGRILWGRLTVSIVRDSADKPQFSLVMIEDITERQRVEEAHLQNAAIVEFSNDAIISKTFDGVIFSWNPAAERVYGYSAQEKRRSVSIIVPSDREKEFERILERIKQGEHIDNFETTRIRKDGSVIYVSMTTSPIKDVAGKIIGASSISRDITGRKQAEAALRESEENYRKLVELSPDGILIQCEGKYVYLNSAAVVIAGARTPGQIIGKAIFDIIHPDYHETTRDNVKVLNAGEDVALHEMKLIRVDGGLVDVEVTATPFLYRGKPASQVVVRDITARKRAEQALRKSEAGLARAQRIAHLGNWELDLRQNTLGWSDETYRIFGLNREEHACTNELFFSCVHPDDRQMVRDSVSETLRTGKPYGVDHRIILPSGEIKTVNEQAEVILDERGAPIRLLGTVLDITERKRAENLSHAFAKLGQRLSSASTAVDAAQIIADVADKLFGWDACNLVLCSRDLQSFKSIFNMDLINGERCAIAPSGRVLPPSPLMRDVLDKGAQLILRETPKILAGETHPFGDHGRASASIMYVPVRNGEKIIGVFSIHSYCPNAYTRGDLDTMQALGDHCGGALERIRAEVENQKLAAFPQFNPNPVMELAPDGSINYFNEAARQMALSLGKQEPAEFLPPETAAFVKECLMTGSSKLRLQTVIQNRAISWSFFPVQTIGVVHCYAGDVTDRQNLEAQLRQAQKMESVGQLAGGIAHDFNNILTVIQGHGSLLAMSPSLNEDAKDSAQQIGIAAERAANLTRQLLTFSRRQIMQPKNLDLNEVVNNMTKMLRRLLGEDISLQVSYTPSLPLIHADPGMMEQILLNLSINARDAMPKGGKLYVGTSLVSVDDAYVQQTPEAVVGDYVRLTVKDNGTGIPPEILPHIFEPFFTTKDIGKGTGLGLATVYGIAQQHHGFVTVTSILNKETVFQIFLPVVKGRAAAGPVDATPTENKVHGGKETILIVEDEPPLRVLVRSVLERYGYRVLEAVSGVAALPLWDAHKDEIQLLLTDMVMPHGLSGQDLGRRLLAEKPKLKVIYCSGYSLAVVGADMVLQEGLNFLQKPYHPRKLAQAIRDCLDGQSKAS